ncbi:unnamed protein product, partial [Mesorhabditis spiculigera]
MVVVVEDKPPVRLPRSRTTSVAKTLEKDAIMEKPVAGSTKDEDSGESDNDDDLSDGPTHSEVEYVEEELVAIDYMLDNLQEVITKFPCEHTNIIPEFADVEFFMVSVDSLIIECCAHSYHNWNFSGQTRVLNAQVDNFLHQFTNLGGKFKLVIFSQLAALFKKDTTLGFIRNAVVGHLSQGPYKNDIEVFESPIDGRWAKYIADLTPSFFMVSTNDPTTAFCSEEDMNFKSRFETIVLDVLARTIPVVPLTNIVVNFSSVRAYYISPKLIQASNHEQYLEALWGLDSGIVKADTQPATYKSLSELWAHIIRDVRTSQQQLSPNFDALACAILLSAAVTQKRGSNRVYPTEKPDGKRGIDVIRDRRHLLKAATTLVEKLNWASLSFPVAELWDGRMIMALFDAINAGESVLPYRLQDEFAAAHTLAGLDKPIPTDTTDKLLDDPTEEVAEDLTLPCLHNIKSALFDTYLADIKGKDKPEKVDAPFSEHLKQKYNWKFSAVPEQCHEETEKVEDPYLKKRANRSRQFLSRWYEQFANSLEGRATNLLVDFSRAPRANIMLQEDAKETKGWAGQKKGGGGGKKGKSKKEEILEANKANKANKVLENERQKIKFALQQGKNAVAALGGIYFSLETPEMKATCDYEMLIRHSRDLQDKFVGDEHLDDRRRFAVDLVGLLKKAINQHWEFMDDKQKDDVANIWYSLGFEPFSQRRASTDAKSQKLTLKMNPVYYQMRYGGELIDIQSDPQKDERVTGFHPDSWQRDMLNVVDKGNSALIVAPTSAGKTFISYYCIEKILRASDEDVVVYVSPSKALTNQVCGSIYARFRNKSMTPGKSLFGTLWSDYNFNALNCQVLVTVPDAFEDLLLSKDAVTKQFVNKIRYVIFDEVHSIGSSDDAVIWEHLILLINCPFLALSATIGNVNKLHEWMFKLEQDKTNKARGVSLIVHQERYSELELAIQDIVKAGGAEKKEELIPFIPYGVYMPEKIRMFGIPEDQQLTSRQILELWEIMSQFDEQTKKAYEPCSFFKYTPDKPVWLSRSDLRKLESTLKDRFMHLLKNDEATMLQILKAFQKPLEKQLDARAKAYDQEHLLSQHIVSLIDNLQGDKMLPAICFNEDRSTCEKLARQLAAVLEQRQLDFEMSAEFKEKFEIKNEEKLMKLAKRKRDAAEKKKKGDKPDEEPEQEDFNFDPLAAQRAKLKDALAKFRLHGRTINDTDAYEKMTERMKRQAKGRESTRILLQLFERGIGFHHDALSMVEKGAVEVLFRTGHLSLLFSTSTLALGINMPCKTIIFGIDDPKLTPLLYRQMSGRAGRRGFDHSGKVIFTAIPTGKMRRLLTGSLPNLHPNPPFTISYLLRIFSRLHQVNPLEDEGFNESKATVQAKRLKSATNVLTNSFALITRDGEDKENMMRQLRVYTWFSAQLLRQEQLIDNKGTGRGLYQLVSLLQASEPGNLIFAHLIQNDIFHQLCRKYKGEELKLKVLHILATLFTRVYLPPDYNTARGVHLLPLSDSVKSEVDSYATSAMGMYGKYMSSLAPNGNLMDPDYAVSGATFTTEHHYKRELVPVFNKRYAFDESFLPAIDLEPVDHRGHRLYLNSYALDFWKNESRNQLLMYNKIPVNRVWYLLEEFKTSLAIIGDTLQLIARPADVVADLMLNLSREYDDKFRRVFGMKKRT